MSRFHPRSPIAFAHRGGRAHFRENTLLAFRYALSLGLKGLETDAWLTSDDEVVLDHDGVVRSWLGTRRTPIARVVRAALPKHVPTLDDLCELMGPDVELSVDARGTGDAIVSRVVEVFSKHHPDSLNRLWIAAGSYETSTWNWVADARTLSTDIHLMNSTRRKRFAMSTEKYARHAKDAGFDVLNLPAKDWDRDLVEAVHDAGLLCFGFNAQKRSTIKRSFELGLDGIYSDHVDRLAEALKNVQT